MIFIVKWKFLLKNKGNCGNIERYMRKFMEEALKEAQNAADIMEVPIGAVVVRNGEIIGRGYNLTESNNDPTMHAEIIAIREATKSIGYSRLYGCELYVTCEPCTMCAGAIVLARIKKVIIGTMDKKTGACGSIYNILQQDKLNHQVEIETGVLAEECSAMMTDFFKRLRKSKSED